MSMVKTAGLAAVSADSDLGRALMAALGASMGAPQQAVPDDQKRPLETETMWTTIKAVVRCLVRGDFKSAHNHWAVDQWARYLAKQPAVWRESAAKEFFVAEWGFAADMAVELMRLQQRRKAGGSAFTYLMMTDVVLSKLKLGDFSESTREELLRVGKERVEKDSATLGEMVDRRVADAGGLSALLKEVNEANCPCPACEEVKRRAAALGVTEEGHGGIMPNIGGVPLGDTKGNC